MYLPVAVVTAVPGRWRVILVTGGWLLVVGATVVVTAAALAPPVDVTADGFAAVLEGAGGVGSGSQATKNRKLKATAVLMTFSLVCGFQGASPLALTVPMKR